MSSAGSIISALGAGSGVDMARLASDLATAQFQQRTEQLSARRERLSQQISTAASLRNSLFTLASSLGERVRTGDLAATPQVANPAIATASSPAGTRGSGTYTLEVTQLARRQALASPAMANATDPVGAGTLTIRFGIISGTDFTPDTARSPVEVQIASGSSLTSIASAITAARAGLTAYVANTVDGARLVVKGPEGEASGFIIEATETPGEEGLAALAWEPSSGAPTRLLESAADAVFLLDGLAMRSATNQTGQIAPGLTLSLAGTNPGNPTRISFSNPAANIREAMSDLVSALNEIAAQLRQATDPQTGELRGDPGARALRQRLAALGQVVVMPNALPGEPRTLNDLGLAIERDGSFRLDEARLSATLSAQPEATAAMFTNGLFGVYASIDKLARDAGRSSDPGSLAGSVARYERLSAQVSARLADIAEQQEALRASLTSRFARSEAQVGTARSTLTFLQQQIDAWNAQRR